MIKVGYRVFSRILLQRWLCLSRFARLCNGVGTRPTKHHQVKKGVGSKSIGPVNRGTGCLPTGIETRYNVVTSSGGVILDHLAFIVGGDSSHVIVHSWQDRDGFLGYIHPRKDAGGLRDAR